MRVGLALSGVALTAGCGRLGFDVGDRDASTPLFADGFEGLLDPWTALGNASVAGGPPAPFEGTSMLVAQAQTEQSARAEVALPSTVMTGSLYVRAYYFLPSGYAITDLSLLEISQSGANLTLATSPAVGLHNGIDLPGSGVGTYALPRDAWTCVEARVGIADAGTWELRVDGVLRHELSGIDTFAGGIDGLHVGITWNGPSQEPSIVYVDAVAASTAPVGCL